MSRIQDSSTSQRGRLLFLFSNPRPLVGTLLAFVLVCGMGSSDAAAQCAVPDYCRELDVLSPSDAANYYQFGFDVAISGDAMIASSIPQSCSQSPQPCAAAYIYRWDGTAWQEEAKLVDAEGRNGDAFGFSVDIDGDVAIVGAPYAGPTHKEGAAFIFRYNGSTLSEEARLTGSADLGRKVKVQGDMALVSEALSSPAGTTTGVVHVYRNSGGVWTIQDTLKPSVVGDYANYGTTMALGNGLLAIGAYGTPHPTQYGAVYLYELVSTQWIERQVIQGSYFRNRLGDLLSISNDLLLIGGDQETTPMSSSAISIGTTARYGLWRVRSPSQTQQRPTYSQ